MNKKYLTALMAVMLAAPLSVKAEGKNGVAAVVNGDRLTVSEVRDLYDNTPQIHTQEKWDVFYGKAVDAWIGSRLLLQAANAANIKSTPEYKKQLEAAGNEIATRLYLRREIDKQISEEDLKKMYEQYKTNFVSEKEMRARHILVDKEATANEVIAKITKGESFDELAKQYSKEKKVDLGYFTKDMMVPEFGKAAFAMKKGEYSQKPIKSQFGYHIILVDDVRSSQPLSYKDAEPQLKAIVGQEAMKKVMSDVNQGAKIEKYSLDGSPAK